MIIIYSTSWCPSCVMAKKLLDEKNISYNEVNIEERGWDRNKLKEITGAMTVPQIVINEKPIGGYESLLHLNQSGDLERLLEKWIWLIQK